jgi:hypothetical protein
VDYLEEQGSWSGSTSELLTTLEGRLGDQVKRQKTWPKNARALSGQLKRLGPNLRKKGWNLDQDRNSKKRYWTIHRASEPNGFASSQATIASSAPVFASQDGECKPMQSGSKECEEGPNVLPNDANDTNDAKSGDVWNRDKY